MQAVFDNLSQFHQLATVEIEFLSQRLHPRIFDKKENLVREGQYSNRIYFIEYGLIHHYDKLGKTNWVLGSMDIVVCYDPFFKGVRSTETVQALEKTSTHSISKPELDLLKQISPTFINVENAAKDKYRSEQDAYASMLKMPPEEKYKWLLENKVELLTLVSNDIIASYLDISPTTWKELKRNGTRHL